MIVRPDSDRAAHADGNGIDWLASTDWVDAAPFAAHLRSLWAETRLPWRVLATAAGVPAATARSLLAGGRPRRRIRAVDAWSLMQLSSERLRAAHRWVIDAAPTTTNLIGLIDAGWSACALASALAIDEPTMTALLSQQTRCCTQVLAWRAEALCDAVGVETVSMAELQRLAA